MAKHAFIKVRYGDDQEALFNPWCLGYVLLESIKRKCECEEEEIDLIDLQGKVRNIQGQPHDYVSNYITGRETFVLVRVDRNGDGDNVVKYTALLNNLEQLLPELMEKMNNITKPQKTNRRSSGWNKMRTVAKMKTIAQKAPSEASVGSRTSKSSEKRRGSLTNSVVSSDA